ncbi:dentin sialophosphoprotein-like isoform X3 [Cardiocondyla obscurior]|uniref:dentin sialophosphoprotein-like isoform X3 n=1 Tax=Cardiocondyla obscurior TaxID=286306 RepID=UPI0039658B90
MSTSTALGGGGALSLMGCMREASPPPQNHHQHHHHQQHRTFGLGDFPAAQPSVDPLPKEPKKRRFHPLRGLRKIFRRKSRGAADARSISNSTDRDTELARLPREEITMRHPAGRPEEARSRSASELLTDSCDRESVFLRRSGVEDSFIKLRGGAGKLSVSHDSVFPGEVPHTRPLSSLASLATLERRQARKSNEIIEHKEYNHHHVAQRHRISLRVLEQIKTAIENRNQLASVTSPDTGGIAHAAGERYQQETTENRFAVFDRHGERSSAEESQAKITRSTKDTFERIVPVAKEDLPQLESASLSHTAAHHRISVRPKNRRPPRRTTSTTPSGASSSSPSIPPTIAEDTLDSLEHREQPGQSTSNAPSPTEPPKAIGVTRKSSSRLSRNSDIFEELESRLPRKPSATSLSPDSLDTTTASRSSAEITTTEEQQTEVRWIPVARKPSNRISKGSDVFEELETKLPRRRSSSNRLSKSPDSLDSSPGCWFSKSTEDSFDKLVEYEETVKPVAAVRRQLLTPIFKSTDRVSKSSDSLEAIEPLASDDSIERRRSSFDFQARRNSKTISKSSESFDVLEQSGCGSEEISQELQKRSSVSDINLSRGRRLSKSISKSESFERIDMSDMKDDVAAEVILDDDASKNGRRSSKRMSSESSDNLDVEDRLENRRVRRTPKRISSTNIVDVGGSGDDHEGEKRLTPTRKPSRLEKSSESSELGSTDTLDSERRNKSSESTETLDSLEKDLEQDRKEEEITDSVIDRREKNDSWSSRNVPTTDSDQTSMGDDTEDSKSLISAENKYYWRQSSEPQMSTSQPSSPVAKQEDTKMLFDNLLVSNKNDEDLQNMLNGNISEVSTDTKSFKEKLIMFEKLGK